MTDYHINVFYSDEDGGYIADIPDLDTCSAFGENPNLAVAEVLVAKRRGWRRPRMLDGRSPNPGTDRRSTLTEPVGELDVQVEDDREAQACYLRVSQHQVARTVHVETA
jgi:hypothetical protein